MPAQCNERKDEAKPSSFLCWVYTGSIATQHSYQLSIRSTEHVLNFNFTARPTCDNMLPHFADHTYREFSTYIEKGGKIEKHKKSDRNFPARLHAMLSDEQYSHIISWMPHGRAWKVLNKELLMVEAIPKFFGQSKYASFTRQLSGWGFKRLHLAGPDYGCYYHECFLRGKPQLTQLMRRVPGGQGKLTPNMLEEPDFYNMAKYYPLEKSANTPIKEKNEASKYDDDDKDKDVPHAAKQAAAASMDMDMESIPTHHWDPYYYYQQNTAYAAATGQYGGGTKEYEYPYQEAMKYGPFPVSHHHFDPRGYSMHQAHREASASQYEGSKATPTGYYHPHLHDAHYNWYSNPYHSNYHSAQGGVHGNAQHQGASAEQPHPSSLQRGQYQYSPIAHFTQMNSNFTSTKTRKNQVPNPELDA